MLRSIKSLLVIGMLCVLAGRAAAADLSPPEKEIAMKKAVEAQGKTWEGVTLPGSSLKLHLSPWIAYNDANDHGKRMVVIFMRIDATDAQTMTLTDALVKEHRLDSFANSAVFLIVDPSKDDEHQNVASMAKELGITSYPTVTVVDASTIPLLEIDRITSFTTSDDFTAKFVSIISKNTPKNDTTAMTQN